MIQPGRVWPALPSREDYIFEPKDPAKVAHDYRRLATVIADGGKDGTWPACYRFLVKVWGPKDKVIAFHEVEIVLADLHHSVAVVQTGKIFAQTSPGHIVYCELARIAYYGYTGVHDLYKQSTESNDFTAIIALHTALQSYFDDERTPYSLPQELITALKWLPNNVLWLAAKKEGSNHYDCITYALIFTTHQVLASLAGVASRTPCIRQMQRPIVFLT